MMKFYRCLRETRFINMRELLPLSNFNLNPSQPCENAMNAWLRCERGEAF